MKYQGRVPQENEALRVLKRENFIEHTAMTTASIILCVIIMFLFWWPLVIISSFIFAVIKMAADIAMHRRTQDRTLTVWCFVIPGIVFTIIGFVFVKHPIFENILPIFDM